MRFLIHVPELNRFEDDAKDSMAKLSFAAAKKMLHSKRASGVKKLAVAIRGNLLYDQVWMESYETGGKESQGNTQIDSETSVMPTSLLPFFAEVKDIPTEVKQQ